MRHRATSKGEDKRLDHKRERAATRQVLDGGHLNEAHGTSWSHPLDKVPILDDTPQIGHRSKGSATHCKRNKGGPHIIEAWPRPSLMVNRYDEESGKFVRTQLPWWQRPYHPPYRCSKCGKGFYRIPKRGAVMKPVETRVRRISLANWENEVKDDHHDLYNIRSRLLDLPCQCKECNEANSE